MVPTLLPGDRLFVDRARAGRRAPAIGDLVVFPDPTVPSRLLVKRVAAVGGDRLWVGRDRIVRAVAPDSATAPSVPPGPDLIEEVRVPVGHVFVLSDAARGGHDSRQFGPVPSVAIRGWAWWRYAPAERRGPVGEPTPEPP